MGLPDAGRQALRHREHPFFSGSPPVPLLKRLTCLRFSLDEESEVTFVDALHRVRAVLDASPDVNLFARRPWYAERSDELAMAMTNGEPDAFSDFILLHWPLARHISKRLQRTYGMAVDDAEQIGVIGLIKAARRFKPDRGYQFSTYATYWVRQACQSLGPDAGLFIRLPINVRSAFFPIRRHLEKVRTAFGPGRVNDELARLCAEDKRFFRQWLAFERAVDVRSLSDPQEPEYFEARTVAAPADDEPLHRVLHREQIERIRATLECLQPRQRRLIRLRYGMEGDPLTLEEIGLVEGITRERVRQILFRAEERLRHFMERKLTDLVPMTSVVVTDAETEMESGPTSV